MQKMIHPISGESGFFCSEKEKNLIDVIILDFENRHLVVTNSSRSARGVVDD